MNENYIVHIPKRNDTGDSPQTPPPVETDSTQKNEHPHPTEKTKVSGTFHVALHITDHEIYVLQMTHESKFTRFGKSTLPEHTVENGIILDSEQLAQHIRVLLKEVLSCENIPSTIYGNICIPKSQTYIQHIVLPSTSEPLTYELVSEKISKLLPFSKTEVSIEFTHWKEDAKEHIICAVVPHSIIDSYSATARIAGLTPVLIDMEGAALGRALLEKNQHTKSLIIDIGARNTALNSYLGQEIVASVFAPVGNDKLEEILSDTHPYTDAEKQKQFEDITATLIQAITLVVQESEVFFHNATIDNIHIVGSSSLLSLLAEYIGTEVGIPTHVGNPLLHLTEYPSLIEGDSILYASAIGLALRTDNSNAGGFNLLITQVNKKTSKKLSGIHFIPYIKNHVRELLLFFCVLISSGILFVVW
jgi:type IV pilus assembly protein PilM